MYGDNMDGNLTLHVFTGGDVTCCVTAPPHTFRVHGSILSSGYCPRYDKALSEVE